MDCLDIPNKTIFTMEMTPIKFGPGSTDEVAYGRKRLGVKHTSIITDRGIMQLGLPDRVRTLIQEAGISADGFDEVHVEPIDHSFEAIATFVRGRDYDGFVSVGGGSCIDSAKAANLFTTYPAPLMDCVKSPLVLACLFPDRSSHWSPFPRRLQLGVKPRLRPSWMYYP
jgi:hydroxyacid-oxoacid transhydrogenase